MSEVSSRMWVLAASSLCTPPSLLALAFIGKSSELLIASFVATVVTLLINSLFSLGLLVLWFVGVDTVTRGKTIRLLFCAGVVTDVVILWLMPPLAK